MENSKKSVRLEVSEGRKEQWMTVATQEDRTLSDLIRRAMSQYIAAKDGTGGDNGGGISESIENDIVATKQTTENIQQQVNRLSNRFDVVESEVRTRKEVRTVANRIYEVLPGATEAGNYVELLDGGKAQKGSLDWIADSLNETSGMVEQAIDQLLTDSYDVHRVGGEGGYETNVRYYKEGGQ